MAFLMKNYRDLEEKILNNLEVNGIKHRSKNPGLWLGPITGLIALVTFLRENNSYSEICLLTGITGLGLIICCLCLYGRLSMNKSIVKDFHVLYFLPAIILSTSYLLRARKGLFVSTTWGLILGSISTWGTVQTMSHFPNCFTLGEATVVVHCISLFLLSVFTNLPLRYHLPPIHDSDIATVILQVGILAIVLTCLCCWKLSQLKRPMIFLPILVGVIVLIVIPSLYMLLDQNPVLWVFLFICSSSKKIWMFSYFVMSLLGLGIYIFYHIQSHTGTSIARRKIFHIFAVAVYLPGILWEPLLLYLASGIVLAFTFVLELVRILNISCLGQLLQDGFESFADEKDSIISLTPLYLLCGLSLPLWLPTENLGTLPLLSGVLSIGIGDTVAGIYGARWGRHKWPNSNKTIEGTIASIFAQMIVIYSLHIFDYIEAVLLVKSFVAVTITAVVEARTEQIDNLALPFIMYLCLVI